MVAIQPSLLFWNPEHCFEGQTTSRFYGTENINTGKSRKCCWKSPHNVAGVLEIELEFA